MEIVPNNCSEVDFLFLLDDMQGTVHVVCSIWWTPVGLQVTGENNRSL